MNEEERRRATIVNGLRAGRTVKDIVKFHNFKRTTVFDIKKKFDAFIAAGGRAEDFTGKRKKHKRRSDAMGDDVTGALVDLIDEDPGRSMRSMAKELNISPTTVRRKVRGDIRYKSYAMRRGQFMNDATKERRCAKAKLLLLKLKRPTVKNQLIFFSDEKNFSQDQKINRRNNRWLCGDPSDVPIVMQTKFPSTVMVLGVVSNEGDVMPPHFFKKSPKNQHGGVSEGPQRCCEALDGRGCCWAALRVPARWGAGPQLEKDPGVVRG